MPETELKKETRLAFWPSPQDYNESIQNSLHNLTDEELRSGLVYLDQIGIPRAVSGAFASVYRFKCPERDLALRCFLFNISDQKQRYELVSGFVRQDDLPYTVTFDFLEQGLKVGNSWFPTLKMEWVDGEALDHYMLRHLTEPNKLLKLATRFLRMMDALQRAGIAHGDLQHGNIMVLPNGELRLVDYDSMYVPSMKGMKSNERGHRNYQHPERNSEHFGPNTDNFSAWIIYTSIVALQLDAKLWYQLGAGDDCLLFRQADFVDPLNSPAFAALEKHYEKRLRHLARFIRSQLMVKPEEVPSLSYASPGTEELPDLSPTVSQIRKGGRVVSAQLADWLTDEDIAGLSIASPKDRAHHLPPPPSKWIAPEIPTPPMSQESIQELAEYPIELELLQPRPRLVKDSSDINTSYYGALLAMVCFWLFFLPAPGNVVAILLLFLAIAVAQCIMWCPTEDQKELISTGEVCSARITEKTRTVETGFYRYDLTLKYITNWEPLSSCREIEKQIRVSPLDFLKVQAGDLTTILYDQHNPERCVIYKLCKVRAVVGSP